MSDTAKIVNECIQSFLAEYMGSPILHLRESSTQSQLRDLIQKKIEPKESFATVKDANSKTADTCGTGNVYRTQEEMKVGEIAKQRSDIIVFRSSNESDPIHLFREKNGALDIIAKTRIEDIEAVIEIKAACSADKSQRQLFRKDLFKLLEITPTNEKLSRHFVLIDKSVPTSNFKEIEKKPKPEWWLPEGDPQEQTLKMEDNPPKNKPFVHVWWIAHNKECEHAKVEQRYCIYA